MYAARQNKSIVPRTLSISNRKMALNKIKGIPLVQKYATFHNDDNVYNITDDWGAICGLNYPNHELYVLNFDEILNKEDSMISLSPKGKKTFPRLKSKWGAQEYIKVEPKWKNNNFDFTGISLIKNFCQFNKSRIFPQDRSASLYNKLNIVRKSAETIRKYFTQLEYKWKNSDYRFKDIYENYRIIYYDICESLYAKQRDGLSMQTMKKSLEDLINMVKIESDAYQLKYNIFDNAHEAEDFQEMSKLIIIELDKIKTHLPIEMQSNPFLTILVKEAFLYEQCNDDNVKLPRGCDKVAALFGLYGNDSKMLNFQVKGNRHHHYSTIIYKKSFDFITIEGFAKKDYDGVDNTWEFMMHGHFMPEYTQAFNDYTKIRYKYFKKFKDNVVDAYTINSKTNCCTYTIKNFINKNYLTSTGYASSNED